jgi:hypothetical protein
LALILFFLQLTIQMRVDRLDGTGDVVWADDACMEGVVAGFLGGLASGRVESKRGIPSGAEILDLLRFFSRDEWLGLMEHYLETYRPCREELYLIQEYGSAHLDKLRQVLAAFG